MFVTARRRLKQYLEEEEEEEGEGEPLVTHGC
jgi:hypothetical protein